MARITNAASIAAQDAERAKMAELLSNPGIPEVAPTPQEEPPKDADAPEKVVIVKIPSRYTEDKVKTLMGTLGAQFNDTGYRVVFAPEEVDVYVLGQDLPQKTRWT